MSTAAVLAYLTVIGYLMANEVETRLQPQPQGVSGLHGHRGTHRTHSPDAARPGIGPPVGDAPARTRRRALGAVPPRQWRQPQHAGERRAVRSPSAASDSRSSRLNTLDSARWTARRRRSHSMRRHVTRGHGFASRACLPPLIAIYGWSLGSGVATDLASAVDERAVVLEGAFSGVDDRASELYPWLPIRLMVRNRFASRERIARLGSPLLLLHATDDTVVPVSHARTAAGRGAGASSPRRTHGRTHTPEPARRGAVHAGAAGVLRQRVPVGDRVPFSPERRVAGRARPARRARARR